MKDFMKKKMYLILLVVSFSTLFSAILYADPIYCEKDSDCPPGKICVIPGNYCIDFNPITCTENYQYEVTLVCYKENPIYEHGSDDPAKKDYCIWTGLQFNTCFDNWY